MNPAEDWVSVLKVFSGLPPMDLALSEANRMITETEGHTRSAYLKARDFFAALVNSVIVFKVDAAAILAEESLGKRKLDDDIRLVLNHVKDAPTGDIFRHDEDTIYVRRVGSPYHLASATGCDCDYKVKRHIDTEDLCVHMAIVRCVELAFIKERQQQVEMAVESAT